ncbi:hypothetical protein ACNAN0_02920 [Agrilactobacillus fermenti]|uniref:hypothetical protein n=1 Tax=Agrilactobacillus fermenti TaxID=2586909 RepID=UPI003A5BD2B4
MGIFKRNSHKAPTIASAMVNGVESQTASVAASDTDENEVEKIKVKKQAPKKIIPEGKLASEVKSIQIEKPENVAPYDSVSVAEKTALDIANLKTKMHDLSTEYDQLRDNLKVKMFQQKGLFADELAKAKHSLQHLESQLDQLNAQAAELQAKDDHDLLQQQAEVNKAIPEIKKGINQVERQLSQANQQLTANQKNQTTIQQQLDESKAAAQKLSDTIKNESDLVKMMALVEENKKQALTLVAEQKEYTEKQATLDKESQTIKAQLEQLQTQLNDDQTELTAKQRAVKEIESQIENARRQRAQKQAALATQQNNLKQQMDVVSMKISGYQSNLESMQKQIKAAFGTSYFIQDVQFDQSADFFVMLSQPLAEASQTDVDLLNYLQNQVEKPLTLVSLTYDPQLKDHLMSWAKQKQLTVPKVINIFTEIQASAENTAPVITIHESDNLQGEWSKDHRFKEYHDIDGQLKMVAAFGNGEQMQAIRYYENGKLNKMITLNDQGQLSRSEQYNDDGQVTVAEYYRVDGTLALKCWHHEANAVTVEVYDNNELKTQSFASEADFDYWWLSSYLGLQSNIILVGMDNDITYRKLISEQSIPALPYLVNVKKNLSQLKAMLHGKHPWLQMLVSSRTERSLLEGIIDRDINISCVSTQQDYALPKSLGAEQVGTDA